MIYLIIITVIFIGISLYIYSSPLFQFSIYGFMICALLLCVFCTSNFKNSYPINYDYENDKIEVCENSNYTLAVYECKHNFWTLKKDTIYKYSLYKNEHLEISMSKNIKKIKNYLIESIDTTNLNIDEVKEFENIVNGK